MSKITNPTKIALIGMAMALKNALIECEKLPCECDSYHGYVCPIQEWRLTLTRVRDELHQAIEAEEDDDA